ncbi:MAG TPA: hypothetical protein VIZ30_01565 [Pseudomonadales bacterium]
MRRTIVTASRIPVSVFDTPAEAGAFAAEQTAIRLERAQRTRGHMTLGCPGGRSLRTTYAALARRAANAHADLSALHLVMMDEYVEPRGATWTLCPSDAHYSCRRFGDVEIRGVLNAALAERSQIPARNLHVPDPAAPDQYESLIERLGGIDVFLLASGQTDGHVAFNPRGSSAHEHTRVIELTQETRRDNLTTFPQFRDLDAVPRWGVSVGTGTIARHSRAAILMLLGEGKGQALRRIAAVAEYDPDWPASIVLACADAQIVADVAAAAAT